MIHGPSMEQAGAALTSSTACFLARSSANSQCSGSNSQSALIHLKLVACCSIFAACTVGVWIPILGPRMITAAPSKMKMKILKGSGSNCSAFVLLKAFSAGVVLGTGFVHMLPDAFQILGSQCLPDYPWQKFPFAGFTAMLAAVATLLLDLLGTAFYETKFKSSAPDPSQPKLEDHPTKMQQMVAHNSADHDLPLEEQPDAKRNQQDPEQILQQQQQPNSRSTVIAQVLELGMVAHSIIIGITLGSNHSPCSIRPLVAALTFHQLFEGLALGGCISEAGFTNGSTFIMSLGFGVTTPIGIAIGIAISSTSAASDHDPIKAVLVEGFLDAVSAGILIYMALVDLIATDFLQPQQPQGERRSYRLQLAAYASLLAGSATMALVAFWA